MSTRFVFSCEHGGNRIPARYRGLFEGQAALLATHRGYDIGALPIARSVALALRAPLAYAVVSRLVIDLNRSLGHRSIFSSQTAALPEDERKRIIERHYLPYRDAVRRLVRRAMRGGVALHVSMHTFTPVLDGQRRNADIGLLYDPRHDIDREFCLALARAIAQQEGELRLRLNYPYRGVSDSVATALRRELSPARYVGIEIEVNQALASRASSRRRIARALARALERITQKPRSGS
jgi:predicted N-formylglutamate amidohydrolase